MSAVPEPRCVPRRPTGGGAVAGRLRAGVLVGLLTGGLLLAAACTSSSSGGPAGSTATTGSTAAGARTTGPKGTVDAAVAATAITSPPTSFKTANSGTVPLPPVAPQAEPSGSDDVSKEAAVTIKACTATRDCSNAVGTKVVWPGADLTGMDFRFAQLTGADLRGARAVNANFGGANLSGALLAGATFSGANLSGADLTGTDMTNADLSGANLRGADLRSAIVDGVDLQGALFCQTVMPDQSVRSGNC